MNDNKRELLRMAKQEHQEWIEEKKRNRTYIAGPENTTYGKRMHFLMTELEHAWEYIAQLEARLKAPVQEAFKVEQEVQSPEERYEEKKKKRRKEQEEGAQH